MLARDTTILVALQKLEPQAALHHQRTGRTPGLPLLDWQQEKR